jgi:hypothetical protein
MTAIPAAAIPILINTVDTFTGKGNHGFPVGSGVGVGVWVCVGVGVRLVVGSGV